MLASHRLPVGLVLGCAIVSIAVVDPSAWPILIGACVLIGLCVIPPVPFEVVALATVVTSSLVGTTLYTAGFGPLVSLGLATSAAALLGAGGRPCAWTAVLVGVGMLFVGPPVADCGQFPLHFVWGLSVICVAVTCTRKVLERQLARRLVDVQPSCHARASSLPEPQVP